MPLPLIQPCYPGLFFCDPVSRLGAFDHEQSLAAMRGTAIWVLIDFSRPAFLSTSLSHLSISGLCVV